MTIAPILLSLAALPSLAMQIPAGSGEHPGLVVVVGGVGGLEGLHKSLQLALRMEKVPLEVHNFEWTHGKGHILKDLQDSRHQARKAAELAKALQEAANRAPERPLFLVGRSGGAGLVLAATELLPAGTLERIILLSPAVSPTYDLGPALQATRREIVSFHSEWDWFILGWGTSQFGTADRFYCPSAGRGGFIQPEEADPETIDCYDRLVQVAWTPAMILTGHTGGHTGAVVPTFLAHAVVPWLKP